MTKENLITIGEFVIACIGVFVGYVLAIVAMSI